MEKEWSIPMTYNGRACGLATLRREGLYVQVTCDSEPVTDEIVRAYLTGAGGQAALGVLVPESGRLRLRRRMAASQLPGEDFTSVRIAGREDAWTPWEGEIAGQTVPGARVRVENGRRLAALPYSPRAAFVPMGVMRRCKPLTLEGEPYLALDLDA